MLDLRPICENCATGLPPASSEARICSYECTFCRSCVEPALENVCPNCRGGFVPRPVRPAEEWRAGVSLSAQPASTEKKHHPVKPDDQRTLVARVGDIPPAAR